MKNKPAFDPEEEGELPESWEPQADMDAQLRGILRLAKEADRPVMPTPAQFAAVQMTVRRQAIQEGLIKDTAPAKAAASTDQSFSAWLRALFLGGGAGGQMVRLGLVGACAFYVGSSLISAPEGVSGSVAIHNLTTSNLTGTPGANVPPGRGGEVASSPAGADDSASNVKALPVGSNTLASASTTTDGGDGPAGFRVPRSYVETANGPSWDSTVGSQNAWVMSNNGGARPVAVAAAPAGVYTDGRPDLASQAMDQLQVLKLYSLMDRNERNLAEIRRVEQTLSQLMAQGQWDGRSPRTEAMDTYRVGEVALASGRYHDAQVAFEKVAQTLPGSTAAFLSTFQVGRISYEGTKDYALALESFRECLDTFPPTMMTEDHRNYLTERVQVLTDTQAEGWQSIAAFQAAEKATTAPDAIKGYTQVIETSGSARLAADAAARLRRLALADAPADFPVDTVVPVLRARVERSQPGPEIARIQFAAAEIVAAETPDFQQAIKDYRLVLALKPDDETLHQARTRINQLSTQRMQGYVVDP